MRPLFALSITYLCAALLAGCATIIKGTSQEIIINSNVSGAIIELDGKQIGTTPFKGKIKKGKEKLTVKKPGYNTGYVELKKKDDVIVWGNTIWAVSGYPIFRYSWIMSQAAYGNNPVMTAANLTKSVATTALGIAVVGGGIFALSATDGISGAAWEYSPFEYYVQLKETNRSSLDFFRELAIRYFSTVNHSQIAIDAGENTGEYVTALANLMEGKMCREVAMQSINESLEKSEGNQLIFADKLIDSYYK